jgi:flagellar biosynthesis protein FlhG
VKPFGFHNVIQLGRARTPEPEDEKAERAPPRLPAVAPPGLFRRKRPRRIIAVGGGKGGIGKSLVSSNLGVALAKAGRQVVMVDADLGGANLHTCLGIGQPKGTLSDFINKRVSTLEELATPTGVPNLSLISGGADALDAANPKYAQKLKLLRNLQSIEADYLLLDLGAGTSFNTLDFFLIADHGILVLLPEPTSVENAYRFVKAAFFRKLQNLAEEYGIAEQVEAAISSKEGALKTPLDFVARVKARDPAAGERLLKDLASFRMRLVVNQARTPQDLLVGDAVVGAWRKFFGLEMEFLGAIRYDDEAWKAVRKRRPLLLEQPDSEAGQGLTRIAERLLSLDQKP